MWFIKNLVFHIWVTFREIPADEWAIGEKALAPIGNYIWLGWFSSFTLLLLLRNFKKHSRYSKRLGKNLISG